MEGFNSQLQESKDKEVAKKPIKKYSNFKNKDYEWLVCPNCEDEFDDNYSGKYCKECGQRLDWSV